MSTASKAADLIGQALNEYPSYKHLEIARILDNAGLLAPNLPEPNNYDYGAIWDQVFAYQSEPDWHDAMGYVTTYDGVVEIVGNDTHIHTPDEARHLALVLLAAANHAEEQANE